MGGFADFFQVVTEWSNQPEVKYKYSISKQLECNYLSTSGIVSPILAKLDSGATSHYILINDEACLKNTRYYTGPVVLLPDAGSIQPSKISQLSLLSKVSKEAQTATALSELKSASLISLGQLCDDNCIVLLEKEICMQLKKMKLYSEEK